MADAERCVPVDKQAADHGHSCERRKLSALAPKQTRAYSLPALTDLVPLPTDASPGRVRHGSFPGGGGGGGAAPPRFFIPGVTTAFIDGLPVQSYLIVGKPYTMQKPDNEGTNESVRVTADNRRLKYVLNVLQQPQKARACGNGPRASSDRRPVDPPPVVQLNVLDVTDGGEKDVTMTYDSGFMLYASLEVARPIANGRMHSPPHPPVLTGVAVASAAYLERPHGPSGYFIFPDLSVRHEGWYRLKFSLFEAVKHARDADCDRPFDPAAADAGPAASGREPAISQHQSMANRMEVSSTPFQVFSAKKFPGLEMSTPLSLALAQQGCRVRIRRDIRQRKRMGSSSDKPKPAEQHHDTPPNLHHVRTQSIDSQYREVASSTTTAAAAAATTTSPRTIDSQYSRRRDPSIASITQPRPGLALYPPHVQRPSWDSPPLPPPPPPPTHSSAPARFSSSQRPMLTHPSTLLPPPPPLPPISTSSSVGGGRPKQYDMPMATAHKRAYSPAQYGESEALKQGARPDKPPPPPPPPAPPTQAWQGSKLAAPIEVDDGEESDVEYPQYFTFRKSDKTYGSKSVLYPNGMDRLLHRD